MTTNHQPKANAKALLEQANIDTAKLDNMEAVAKHMMERARRYGMQSASGSMSLTKLAFLFNEGCRTGAMSEGKASDLYKAYAEGFNAVLSARGGIEIEGVTYQAVGAADKLIDTTEANIKTPVSMFRTFGKLAVLPHGLALYQRVIAQRALVKAEDLIGSAYLCMVKVNREIVTASGKSDLSDADVAAGKFEVTDADIQKWISKSEGKTEAGGKSFADKLKRLVDDARKLVKAGECDALRAVYDELVKVEAAFTLAGNATEAGSSNVAQLIVKQAA